MLKHTSVFAPRHCTATMHFILQNSVSHIANSSPQELMRIQNLKTWRILQCPQILPDLAAMYQLGDGGDVRGGGQRGSGEADLRLGC